MSKQYLKFEDDRFHEKCVYEEEPVLQVAHMARDLCVTPYSECKIEAVLPPELVFDWILKSGLSPSDPETTELITKKLKDPDFKNLRVWNGQH